MLTCTPSFRMLCVTDVVVGAQDNCGGTNWPAENTSWIKFQQGFDECYAKTKRYIVKSIECKMVILSRFVALSASLTQNASLFQTAATLLAPAAAAIGSPTSRTCGGRRGMFRIPGSECSISRLGLWLLCD